MRELILSTHRLTACNRTGPSVLIFGSRVIPAVREVNLDLHAGECVAVLGESGAGKSTLLRAVAGCQKPDGGRVILLGRDVTGQVHEGIQYLPPDPCLALRPDVPFCAQVDKAVQDKLEQVIRELGLGADMPERRPTACSGGQIQQMALAICLARAPGVLVLDEPTGGTDPHTAGQILQLLRRVMQRNQTAILLATHDLRLAYRLSQRAIILLNGRVVEEGPLPAVLGAPRHPYTRQYTGAKAEQRRADADLFFTSGKACPFTGRCPAEISVCREQLPPLKEQSPDHRVACHLPGIGSEGGFTG